MPIIRATDVSFTKVMQVAPPPEFADWKYLGSTRNLNSSALSHYLSIPPSPDRPGPLLGVLMSREGEVPRAAFLIEPEALRLRSRAMIALVNREFPEPRPFWSNKYA